jgi:hypothetical protein
MVPPNNDVDLMTHPDRLVADLVAITVRVDRLVKTERSLTALQRDCLLNAIGNLNTFFSIWKRPHIPPEDSTSAPLEIDA